MNAFVPMTEESKAISDLELILEGEDMPPRVRSRTVAIILHLGWRLGQVAQFGDGLMEFQL